MIFFVDLFHVFACLKQKNFFNFRFVFWDESFEFIKRTKSFQVSLSLCGGQTIPSHGNAFIYLNIVLVILVNIFFLFPILKSQITTSIAISVCRFRLLYCFVHYFLRVQYQPCCFCFRLIGYNQTVQNVIRFRFL